MIKAASFPDAHAQRYFLANYPAVYLETYITNLIADFRTAEQQAVEQDKAVASNSHQPCANPQVRVDAPERVLLDSETETLTIRVTNTVRPVSVTSPKKGAYVVRFPANIAGWARIRTRCWPPPTASACRV